MPNPELPIPDVVQQQPKTIEGTAQSFYKGGMGLALRNFQRMFQINDRNVRRFQDKCEGIEPGTDEAKGEADDMRIDSDDIHYHVYPGSPQEASAAVKPAGSGLGASLLKIGVGAALAGTGVGLPLALPGIVSGIGDLLKPAAVVSPAEPKGTDKSDAPTVDIGGRDYELSLEPDTE